MGKRKRSYSRSYSHKDRDSSRSKRKKRSPSRNKKYSRRSKSRSKSYSNRKRNHHSSTSSKSSNKSIPKITRIITEEEKKRELEVKRQMRLAKARLLKFEKEDDPKPNNDRRRKDY